MTAKLEGNALVYCEQAFNTANGKTAHGLVRFSKRYRILGVIDSNHSGLDAGELLDGAPLGIPIFGTLDDALNCVLAQEHPPTHFVIGLAPDGGRLPDHARLAVKAAIKNKLNVDSGLHDFLSDDSELSQLAQKFGVALRDIRKPPPRDKLHFFTGKIEQVKSYKVALLGTDSAIGKRTSAWLLTNALNQAGVCTELIGTGQTAWLQGAKYSIILDSLVNDFVSGEIENVIYQAYREQNPQAIILEGQGSLLNPAYPGGFELLAAGRPDCIVLQHAPARQYYDGFPGYKIQPLETQIAALEIISAKQVIAITINHEGLAEGAIAAECEKITDTTGLPAFDLLRGGADLLAELIKRQL